MTTAAREVSVLLADDEPHIRLFLKKAIGTMGWRVIAEAATGAEAVEQYRKHRPDVALLDMNMPVMDGQRALEAIRAEFPDAFVVMLTSVSSADVIEECLEAGAANYIRKDTNLRELEQELRQTWLDHLVAQDGAEAPL